MLTRNPPAPLSLAMGTLIACSKPTDGPGSLTAEFGFRCLETRQCGIRAVSINWPPTEYVSKDNNNGSISVANSHTTPGPGAVRRLARACYRRAGCPVRGQGLPH